jgi:hypothetical protein
MTEYIGDHAEDSTVYISWSTTNKNGASTTRATDGSIRIYKNDSTTEKATANGITDTEDFDAITGVHMIKIDTSNDTGDAGFWAAGNDYFVVLFGATIDGETVNHPIAHFSIENRFMRGTDSANTTTPPTAAAIADQVWDEPKSGHTTSGSFGEEVQAHALTSELPAAAPTAAAIADAVWDEPKSGHTTGGSFGEEVQAHALTSELPAAAPTAAAIADAVWDEPKSGHTTGGSFGEEVQAHALTSEIPSAATIADQVWDEPKSGHTTSGSFGEEVQAHALTSEIPAAAPTAAAIADAVWDEPKSGHTTGGSFGEEVQAHALTSELPAAAPTAAAIADAVWDEPKSGHTTGGSFGEEVQAHALTSEIPAAAPTAAAVADAVWDEAQSGHTTAGTFGEHLQGDIDSNITKVLGSTDAASGLHEIGNEYEDDFRIGADLVAIHGTSITEVTSGRIANNFDTFFENGDAATTKTVDDVGSGGGSGLTQQQVRDAMKLPPTAGTPAAGSVDDHLDDLVAFTPAAGAIEVTDIVVNSGGSPLEGAELWITTDSAGSNVVWSGVTESNGNPKDSAGNNPWLDAGTYHIWVQHSSTEFPSLPISKTVS